MAMDMDWRRASEGGLYTVQMAARVLAAKPEKVRSWVEGYKNSGADAILKKDVPRIGGKTVLSFLELVETAFVRHFRAIGYGPQTIRKVAAKLRERHGDDHPFAMEKRFKADGKEIFEEVVTDEGERRLVGLMNDNFMIVSAIEPSLFDQVFYVEDVAREFTPLVEHPKVIMNPTIAFGKPVLRGVGVPTARLYRAYLTEGGEQEAADEFGLSPDDILAAVRFENDLEGRTLH
jgi:uncharacterized protein (DUF433 family)